MKILGFDIGISSIGWAFVENEELRDCGVRIFTKAENPENGESLALPRREARSVRRRLARRKARLNGVKKLLCQEFGLKLNDYFSNDGELPKAYQMSKNTKSVYELRTLALSCKLEFKDLARVFLHIAKHRGYGNKHAKISQDSKDIGQIKKALKHNEEELKNYRSVGEYLYENFYQKARNFEEIKTKNKNNQSTFEFKNVRNKSGNYKQCVSQEWLKNELKLIFEKQRSFGVKLSKDFENELLDKIFFQRELKDFSDKIGFCIYFEGKKRASKESLSAKEFIALTRMINTLKNLEQQNRKNQSGEIYSQEIIKEILNIILDKGMMKYKELRTLLKLDKSIQFKDSKLSYEKGIEKAEETKFIDFKELRNFKKALGGSFEGLERKHIDEIAHKITLIKSKEKLKIALENYIKEHKLEQRLNECLGNLSELDFSGHIDLSLEALEQILPFMREGFRYDEAVKKAGLREIRKDYLKKDFLPPLKDFENLANPVVVRALAEYRKVLNALLKKYGKMHKIHIELTREIGLNHKERQNYIEEQKNNFNFNEEARKKCEEIGLDAEKYLLKMKLFLEQDEFCIYSGEKIKIEHLRDAKMLEIDHIYPYSRSFDDSYLNKVLVFSKENQNKGNKTPFEAFGNDKEKWDKIKGLTQELKKLPSKKKKRILNLYFNDKEAGFISRNLNDTAYIARFSANYTKYFLDFLPLSENEVSISGEKGSKVHVEAISGRLTAMLRHYWGLGQKDRNNHLHHAVDAVIVAYTNAKIIKNFADFKKFREQNKAKIYAKEFAQTTDKKIFKPCENFRNKVLMKIDEIFVSKPPRKRARGALHKESFMSFDDKKLLKSYGGREGVKKALSLGKIRKIGTKIVENKNMVRVDIFKDKKGKFYGVPIYTMDFALGILPNKAVVSGKDKKTREIKDWKEMDEKYEFCFSLFKDDLIKIQKKDMKEPKFCYYKNFNVSNASICIAKHDNKFENRDEDEKILYSTATYKEVEASGIGIQNLKILEKWQVSPLGEKREFEFEPRKNISLKTTKRKNVF